LIFANNDDTNEYGKNIQRAIRTGHFIENKIKTIKLVQELEDIDGENSKNNQINDEQEKETGG
jgi:hypothetical protein